MKSKRKAIASMTIGIIATSFSILAMILPFFWLIAGIIVSVIAIVCGIVAIVLSSSSVHCGQAIAGLVCGIVGCSVGGLVVLAIMVLSYLFTLPLF